MFENAYNGGDTRPLPLSNPHQHPEMKVKRDLGKSLSRTKIRISSEQL